MERKASFKDRAFDKLGINSIRAKAHSFDSQILSDIRSVTTSLVSVNPLSAITDHYTTRPLSMTDVPDTPRDLTDSAMVQDRKMSRPQPPGTITHLVDFSETLQSIAAHYDITPSELAKLNRLATRTIFPGQTLFVPGDDYVSAQSMSPPEHSPTAKSDMIERRVDLPMVVMQEKPIGKVPGHAERLTPSSPVAPAVPPDPAPGDDGDMSIPRRLTDAEARSLDQECHERFIKINVKYITDGQGVVEGTLLVTPNALMFDPNVSDPLVIEKGCEMFGVIAPMEMIISATLYHDIAAMTRKRSHHRTKLSSNEPRHEVYYGANGSSKRSSATDDNVFPEKIVLKDGEADKMASNIVKRDEVTVGDATNVKKLRGVSGIYENSMEIVSKLDIEYMIEQSTEEIDDHADELKDAAAEPVCSDDNDVSLRDYSSDAAPEVAQQAASSGTCLTSTETCPAATDNILESKEPSFASEEMRLMLEETNSAMAGTYSASAEPFSSSEEMRSTSEKTHLTSEEARLPSADTVSAGLSDVTEPLPNEIPSQDTSSEINSRAIEDVEVSQAETSRDIGEVTKIFDVSKKHETMDISQENIRACDRDSNIFKFDDIDQSADVSGNLGTSQNATPSSGRSSGVFSSSIGSISGSPRINTFVNYATGLFRNTSDDRSIVRDITDAVTKIPDVIQTGGSTLISGGSNLLSSLIPDALNGPRQNANPKLEDEQRVDVENAVKLDDMPELFQDFEEFMPKHATPYYDLPLYLNIHVGEPINKQPCSTCPIEAYGRKKHEPEYWFSIPRNKVDQLYAFFLQWTPDKYGDADDFDPAERGFVVVDEEERGDESLEIFNDYFGDNSPRIQRDWEIVSHRELLRRQSTLDLTHESMPRPELIGTTLILTNDDVDTICPFLPARAVGYSWTLVYSSDQHGFSLKTLYRMMMKLDCPVLLAVKDTNENVFGALSSVPFKVSEYFYGTGESFLYRCTPEFKLYRWTGQNNFFIKGNLSSLTIGAGKGMFGLWFDSDLYHGRSQHCDTFNNDVLSDSEDFVVKALEAWAFIDT